MGGEIDMHIDIGYPAVYNNEQLNEIAKIAAEQFMGNENVEETELRMGAEDFGYYSQQIPGLFLPGWCTGIKKKELVPVYIHLLSILMKMPLKLVWE